MQPCVRVLNGLREASNHFERALTTLHTLLATPSCSGAVGGSKGSISGHNSKSEANEAMVAASLMPVDRTEGMHAGEVVRFDYLEH